MTIPAGMLAPPALCHAPSCLRNLTRKHLCCPDELALGHSGDLLMCILPLFLWPDSLDHTALSLPRREVWLPCR